MNVLLVFWTYHVYLRVYPPLFARKMCEMVIPSREYSRPCIEAIYLLLSNRVAPIISNGAGAEGRLPAAADGAVRCPELGGHAVARSFAHGACVLYEEIETCESSSVLQALDPKVCSSGVGFVKPNLQ